MLNIIIIKSFFLSIPSGKCLKHQRYFIAIKQTKNKIIKKEIHSMYKKDHIIMLLLYIHFVSPASVSPSLKKYFFLFSLLAKAKTKIMRNNLIFGEFIVICFIFCWLFFIFFVSGKTAHTFSHIHIKYIYNKLTHFMVHFYSCHTKKNYHHVFCAAYHILHHCKARVKKRQFYLFSVRSVIKSSEKQFKVGYQIF